eukprot:TRINITY_DN7438_c0_g2_i1.p1 TRINITY_DN7438_c0_g2~~TRINITY_DN7438_c0_g2_i1.p1  ORF type:complete len:914 (+),score=169.34 TRINITY_DN7438_c0_g2_i1:216-2744(+)
MEGSVSKERLDEAREILKHTLQAKENNASRIQYKHFPDCLQKVFRTWDVDGNGGVSIVELQAAADAWRRKDERMKMMRFMMMGMTVTVIILSLCSFFAAYLAVDLAKEMRSQNGLMVTGDGSIARVSSADMSVENGVLTARQESSARLLQPVESLCNTDGSSNSSDTSMSCGAPEPAVATRPAEVERSLSSTIPDKLFAQMTKLKLTGTDGVSHMTIHILGFTRALGPSRCGSLVYLSSLHGTVTLDDTDLYLDDELAARASALGIELAEHTASGRRLASGNILSGMFNFFEDYVWECESIEKPKSPSKPYILKAVKLNPCSRDDQCSSQMGRNVMLPGYDEESSSIISVEMLVETENITLSVQRFPNHPFQELVTLTDHVAMTHRSFQRFNGSAYHCKDSNYTAVVGNASDSLDSYYAAFLGRETRSALLYSLPWGDEEVPARQVRVFRLQPQDKVEGALPVPINYEDDVESLLPTRLFFNGARDMNMDVEDIMVQSWVQDPSAAEEAVLNFSLECASSEILDLPLMTSALTERTSHVDFYVQQYLANDIHADDIGLTSYWKAALEREDEDNVGNSSRRLLSKRRPRRRLQDVDGGFEVEFDSQATLSASVSNGCFGVAGEVSSTTSPWSFSGQLEMGKGCQDPSSQFTIDGRVGVSYGWELTKEYKINMLVYKAKIQFGCDLSIGGYIGGRSGTYQYDCGRRLQADSLGNITAEPSEEEESDLELELLEHADGFQSEGSLDGSFARQLSARRRRRRRRRRTCSKAGFEVLAGIGVAGGCGVSRRRIGVSLEGGFDLSLGPWPSPLDARAVGEISAKGCIKLGPFKGCVGFPSLKLFDIDI